MITRPVSGLWGGRRSGSFAGRVDVGHPVGLLTRPVTGLWGGRRAGSFAGRGGTVSVVSLSVVSSGARTLRRDRGYNVTPATPAWYIHCVGIESAEAFGLPTVTLGQRGRRQRETEMFWFEN